MKIILWALYLVAFFNMLAIDVARADFNVGRNILVHVASYHADRDSDVNEINPGVAMRSGMGEYFLTVGGYKNSHYRTSLYAGGGATLWSVGPVRYGFVGGLISGYSKGIMPFILPEVSVHHGDLSAVIHFVPNVASKGVVSLSFAVGF